jgi:5-methylcytosine-specific restriction endonuclease McrA
MMGDEFWQLEHLSDRQLLDGLSNASNQQRSALAELIAHLGEVEERRLHLEAAHGSMFDYCVSRLGMSEDEACRRIDLARLARRLPALFPLLARGEISLSVALLLKPVLTHENHAELLSAARAKSMREARELVAAISPRPDVASSIRKRPERHARAQRGSATDTPPASSAEAAPGVSVTQGLPTSELPPTSPSSLSPPAPARPSAAPGAPAAHPRSAESISAQARATSRIEPLSAQRYKVQFTADATLKAKLEQARDLLRHAHPNGDFAPILDRALDLLIADLLKRRFGVGARRAATRETVSAGYAGPATPREPRAASPKAVTTTPRSSASRAEARTAVDSTVPNRPSPASPYPASNTPPTSAADAARPTPSHIRQAARREVLERDGLSCTWVDASGKRCGSRAWLELDHRHPKGKGGSASADNLRVLCRAHNSLAAERAYGRAHIERAIAARRRHSSDPRWNGSP